MGHPATPGSVAAASAALLRPKMRHCAQEARMTEQSDSATAAQAGSSQRYRNWKAILNLQPIIAAEPLRVGGEYHLNQRCGGVSLRTAVPQGINPRILMLELVEGPGDGGDWVAVEERFAADAGQYDSVSIRDMDGESTSVDVQEVH
jgi:hypothetical protein